MPVYADRRADDDIRCGVLGQALTWKKSDRTCEHAELGLLALALQRSFSGLLTLAVLMSLSNVRIAAGDVSSVDDRIATCNRARTATHLSMAPCPTSGRAASHRPCRRRRIGPRPIVLEMAGRGRQSRARASSPRSARGSVLLCSHDHVSLNVASAPQEHSAETATSGHARWWASRSGKRLRHYQQHQHGCPSYWCDEPSALCPAR